MHTPVSGGQFLDLHLHHCSLKESLFPRGADGAENSATGNGTARARFDGGLKGVGTESGRWCNGTASVACLQVRIPGTPPRPHGQPPCVLDAFCCLDDMLSSVRASSSLQAFSITLPGQQTTTARLHCSFSMLLPPAPPAAPRPPPPAGPYSCCPPPAFSCFPPSEIHVCIVFPAPSNTFAFHSLAIPGFSLLT